MKWNEEKRKEVESRKERLKEVDRARRAMEQRKFNVQMTTGELYAESGVLDKQCKEQEKEIFTEVTRLRSQWGEARTADEKVGVANPIQGALGRLMLVAENYPQLKSNQNFLALQDELAGTENRISVERRRYNDSVRRYNSAIRRIPGRFFAGSMGLEKRTPFEAAPEAVNTVPTVEF